eukprot:349627-Chlamydomonas_euryale.AAC.5
MQTVPDSACNSQKACATCVIHPRAVRRHPSAGRRSYAPNRWEGHLGRACGLRKAGRGSCLLGGHATTSAFCCYRPPHPSQPRQPTPRAAALRLQRDMNSA